ncbi:MAG: glycosyltransferase family 87 protein [Lysobacteraceae bacterium]
MTVSHDPRPPIAAHPISHARWIVAALLATMISVLLAVAVTAFGVPPVASAIAAALLCAACCPWIAKRLPEALDITGKRHPVLSVLWLLLALATLARTVGVALFMADPDQAQISAFWFDDFYTNHSCFSGYWQAAKLAQENASNLYNPEHYYGFAGKFKLDEFLYLPQFLILPMAAVSLGMDFEQTRAIWFSIEGGTLLACMLGLSAWIGGKAGRGAALLIPAIWIATPSLLTLQLGNFQLSAIALSVVAMALFWRDRPVVGGALLGFAVFKLFPGILGIYLIVTRRWRALGWTLGFSALYTVIAFLWLGADPFRALFEFHLPRLANGEAWAFLENPELAAVAAINDSVPGIVMKLKSLGVPGMTLAFEQIIVWGWTVVIVLLTILSAIRSSRMSHHALAMNWLALLALATFRSPFVPDHTGLFAPLWLWSLVAVGGAVMNAPRIAWFAVLWLLLEAVLPFRGTPLDSGDARLAVSSLSQLAAIGLCLWVTLRRSDSRTDEGGFPQDNPLSFAKNAAG